MKKRSYIEGTPEQIAKVHHYLGHTLACLRAMSFSYQTAHWQAKGASFYEDHLLFERLYGSVTEEIDTLAEKLVGYLGSDSVMLLNQAEKFKAYCSRWSVYPDPYAMGLQAEADLQRLLKSCYGELKAEGFLPLGLDDWLMATANAHESNQYLLQQGIV